MPFDDSSIEDDHYISYPGFYNDYYLLDNISSHTASATLHRASFLQHY